MKKIKRQLLLVLMVCAAVSFQSCNDDDGVIVNCPEIASTGTFTITSSDSDNIVYDNLNFSWVENEGINENGQRERTFIYANYNILLYDISDPSVSEGIRMQYTLVSNDALPDGTYVMSSDQIEDIKITYRSDKNGITSAGIIPNQMIVTYTGYNECNQHEVAFEVLSTKDIIWTNGVGGFNGDAEQVDISN